MIDIESTDEIIIQRLTSRRQCVNCKKIYGINVPPKLEGICDVCQGKLYHRDDDKEDVIKERLRVYNAQTKPLIEFYKSKGLLRIVNGENPIEQIKADIMKIAKK